MIAQRELPPSLAGLQRIASEIWHPKRELGQRIAKAGQPFVPRASLFEHCESDVRRTLLESILPSPASWALITHRPQRAAEIIARCQTDLVWPGTRVKCLDLVEHGLPDHVWLGVRIGPASDLERAIERVRELQRVPAAGRFLLVDHPTSWVRLTAIASQCPKLSAVFAPAGDELPEGLEEWCVGCSIPLVHRPGEWPQEVWA